MRAKQWEPQDLRLEGIVLSNGRGDLYEVPCLVIERYRVSEERATELAAGLGSTKADSDDGRFEDEAPWSVQGGIYVGSTALTTLTGQILRLDHQVRAFVTPDGAPISAEVTQG